MKTPTTITVNVSAWARVTKERDEAREAFVLATNQLVQAQEVLREQNNLQDQRDFAMAEIERLRTEYFEMLDSAWGLIANAGGGNWDLQTEEWRQAAICFRNWYLSTPASKEKNEGVK